MDSVTPLAAGARLFLAFGALGSAATDFAELRKVEETEVTFIIVDTMWVFVFEVKSQYACMKVWSTCCGGLECGVMIFTVTLCLCYNSRSVKTPK